MFSLPVWQVQSEIISSDLDIIRDLDRLYVREKGIEPRADH